MEYKKNAKKYQHPHIIFVDQFGEIAKKIQ